MLFCYFSLRLAVRRIGVYGVRLRQGLEERAGKVVDRDFWRSERHCCWRWSTRWMNCRWASSETMLRFDESLGCFSRRSSKEMLFYPLIDDLLVFGEKHGLIRCRDQLSDVLFSICPVLGLLCISNQL